MTTNYQMWLTHNAETEKIRFPVLPEKIDISKGLANTSVTVQKLGEVVIMQDPKAIKISFSSFFPATPFPGVQFKELTPPTEIKDKITIWQKSGKPVHFIVTGTSINLFCIIESFNYYEQGGDIGSLHYSLTLKEYREVTARQVTIEKQKATVENTETRVDNSVQPQTYTVKSGDCLWNIAKKYYGDGSKYKTIYEANKGVIGGNPNLIYPGQVLTIPAA